jgi:hypothetical protein
MSDVDTSKKLTTGMAGTLSFRIWSDEGLAIAAIGWWLGRETALKSGIARLILKQSVVQLSRRLAQPEYR